MREDVFGSSGRVGSTVCRVVQIQRIALGEHANRHPKALPSVIAFVMSK
jgi:hypothetical protein